MTFQESIQTCFVKYADFKGRASKSEFWWWALFVILATIGGSFISMTLSNIIALATLLPYVAVTARRLHDIDKSGWWQLVGFIPLIGFFLMIYWLIQDPVEPNRFGEKAA